MARARRLGRASPAEQLDLVQDLVDSDPVLTYNVHDAKTHFSKLLARVAAGEEVLIAKAGEPVAKIVPVRSRQPRRPDTLRGDLWVAEDFDAPLPDDLLDAFESKP